MPDVSCVKACTKQVCPGNPEAVCKVDLCSDDCAVTFVDLENGADVNCGGEMRERERCYERQRRYRE